MIEVVEKRNNNKVTNRIHLEFAALSDNESFARMTVAAFITPLNPTLEEMSDVKTAISEAVTNAVLHGYESRNSMEDRIEKAVELFKSGYNCSQSVVAAFADMYGFTQEQALRMGASFGGGIGRMRETCGAACGMFLVAGLETGATEATDREGKAANYAVVQELAAEFKKRNGSLICGELLGLKKKEPVSTVPEERTAQYYSKRPCAKMVEEAARIWCEYLEKHPK